MTTHTFQPDHYFTTLGPHEPVLFIDPGDRVVTTCIDADGFDAQLNQVVDGGNPLTGPFYIHGAEPGDTLAVRLEQITPNRVKGWSAWNLDPGVVDPDYVRALALPDPRDPWQPAWWDLDVEAGTAALVEPRTKLGRYVLPLEPMLGDFGVAPEGGQAISTITSGPHGGNMDYRGFKPGVTAYLPVFVPGALFALGDGHAAQSDGEIGGTGIEVSMDVTFQVELIKGRRIHWPRGEDGQWIFTTGNARPLDQALRHATTEMARWLKEDYALDALSAGLLMSQLARYEVGNVFDPAYTMVCKMEKSRLNPMV